MPWYTYVCEKCGEKVQQKASLAYRDVMPLHRGGGGCGDGRLRRLQPATGPRDDRRAAPVRRLESRDESSSGAGAPVAEARPGRDGRAERGGLVPVPRPPDPGAWEERALE